MIRSFLLAFFSLTIITSPFLFPGPGTATCDFGKTPITLKAVNKPVTEILKDIEKQTQFSFVFSTNKTLDNKKTIELYQAPLNLSLHRVLKDQNYSVICNDKQKTITLVFLDKQETRTIKNNSGVSVSTGTADNSGFDDMAEVETVFDEYNKEEFQPQPGPGKKATSMDGATEAFTNYKNKNIPTVQDQEKQETSMDEITDTFNEYKNKSTSQDNDTEKQETSMDGATESFEEYNNKTAMPTQTPAEQDTSMNGVTEAFEEYNNKQSALP